MSISAGGLPLGCGHRTEIRTEPVRVLAPAGDFNHRAFGSEGVGVRHRKTVTAAGEGAT